MSRARQAVGRRGEQLAAAHVRGLGWPILARNWRVRGGELDLVARDGEWLVVLEVRTRRGERFGRPEESIDVRKQRRLLGLAQRYVHHTRWPGAWRIDVIAIELPPRGRVANAGGAVDAVDTVDASDAVGATDAADAADTVDAVNAPTGRDAPNPFERVLPDGTRLRHLRHAVAP